MDYKRIYDQLIEHRQKNVLTNGYIERHHILPRSLGGTDEKSNIVALTGREHYIAHLLLARFNRCSQTAYALWMMQMSGAKHENRPYIKDSRMYEWARKEFIKYRSRNAKISAKGERNSQYGTRWICNLELTENRKIKNGESIPEGWIVGRNKWIIHVNNCIKKKRINICNLELRKNLFIFEGESIPEGWIIGRNKWKIIDYENEKNVRKKIILENIIKENEKKRNDVKKLWNEFINSSHNSLNSFAKEKGIIRMTLMNKFRKYIPDYPFNTTTKPIKKYILQG